MEIRIDKAQVVKTTRKKKGSISLTEDFLFLSIADTIYSFKLTPFMADRMIAEAGLLGLEVPNVDE